MSSSAAPTPDLLSLFVAPLDGLDLRYMVTGAVAAVVYGEPRLTRDVDLVIELGVGGAARLARAFPAADFYVPPIEVMEAESRRVTGGHFNIIHHDTALKADFYLLGEDPLHRWAMQRRLTVGVEGGAVWLAPLEYVIVRKLEWFRAGKSPRHAEDVRAVLRVSGERVDREALERWIRRLDLEETWRSVTSR